MDLAHTDIQILVLVVGALGVLWLLGNFFVLERFRKTLKEDQTVGVRFGEETVLNRKVLRISQDRSELLVKAHNSNRLIFVPIHQVYVADPYSPLNADHDISID